MTHIRRLVLIAVIGGTILAGLTGTASARRIGIDTVSSASTPAGTVEPRASASSEDNNVDLAAVIAGLVVVAGAGVATYAYRTSTRRRAAA